MRAIEVSGMALAQKKKTDDEKLRGGQATGTGPRLSLRDPAAARGVVYQRDPHEGLQLLHNIAAASQDGTVRLWMSGSF